ncbi:DUF58 domain-containing protein [endosymbiont of Riftia pachyptila]|uniref:DUF58 domain-containing protein n=1 Tax=endosymbiont of Riftia pachyptila TaxID=54396 RepID=UPI001F11EEEA|nr:DUF58 domain-containing protein [endosymbiont of Riftia pachyptila]
MSLYPQLNDLLELRHQAHTLGLASHHRVNSSFSGLYASVFRGTGLDFEEVREYREGDDIRNMEWNVTARTNTPHLKVFREERERSVVLCIDKGPHMSFGTRGTFKSVQAARAAALLGWAAARLNDRVGGMLFGDAQRHAVLPPHQRSPRPVAPATFPDHRREPAAASHRLPGAGPAASRQRHRHRLADLRHRRHEPRDQRPRTDPWAALPAPHPGADPGG